MLRYTVDRRGDISATVVPSPPPMGFYITHLIDSPQVIPLLPQLMQLMITRPRDDLLYSLHTCTEASCLDIHVCQSKMKLAMLCAWVLQLWSEHLQLMQRNWDWNDWYRARGREDDLPDFDAILKKIWSQTRFCHRTHHEVIPYQMTEALDSIDNVRAKKIILSIIGGTSKYKCLCRCCCVSLLPNS